MDKQIDGGRSGQPEAGQPHIAADGDDLAGGGRRAIGAARQARASIVDERMAAVNERGDGMAGCGKPADKLRADQPCRTGDENAHVSSSSLPGPPQLQG
ncbi:hypothetical protein GCM10007973_13710 [Polymorphobacter multimanifer]|nr:hypothetical protein GCM10007973_13710 [Polymorphobacter multimanifer]